MVTMESFLTRNFIYSIKLGQHETLYQEENITENKEEEVYNSQKAIFIYNIGRS